MFSHMYHSLIALVRCTHVFGTQSIVYYLVCFDLDRDTLTRVLQLGMLYVHIYNHLISHSAFTVPVFQSDLIFQSNIKIIMLNNVAFPVRLTQC